MMNSSLPPLPVRFQRACEAVAQANASRKWVRQPSDTELLQLYANFKQSKEDNREPEPSALFSPRQHAKWKAWNSLKGTSPLTAMQNYIALASHLLNVLF